MAVSLKPLGDRVLIKRIEEDEQKTSGGIYIPDTAKEKPQRGTVVAVGPGRVAEDGKTLTMNVKVGDEVLGYAKPASGRHFGMEVDEYIVEK